MTGFDSQAVKTEGTYPIDMYVLNASRTGDDYLYYANINQDTYGWELSATGAITSNEIVYTALPIKRDAVKSDIQGEITGINISIPNVDRTIESIIQNNRYLRGNEVFIITGFAQHLPQGSSASYLGTSENHNAFVKEKFYVDSVSSDENVVTFKCKSRFDINKIILPARKFSRTCAWALEYGSGYLGSECDPGDNISAITFPTCDGSLENCRERNNSERYGGFVSIPKTTLFIA